MAFFFVAIILLVIAIYVGLTATKSESQIIIGLGMAASAIGALLDYRQKANYENNLIESEILSNSLQTKYLNIVAKLRHKLVSANVLLVVAGIWVSGYGAVWGTP